MPDYAIYSIGGFALLAVTMGYLRGTASIVLKAQYRWGWVVGMLIFGFFAVVGLAITMSLLWVILRGGSDA